ncbi:MAG TPA: phosphoribosyl-ATP diphosphatase [Spirochaetales bacterium]|mgnify:CR=1 FL=1|nr:phosphoribosyl-ATP diphosphatase [Spirochaetales bacterium]HPD79882.1 phosphoribosyl-ATP diphosphatase [Spirochaetales bacterium]HQK33263.1 phosphoribosyl-ATP diphosphatase [Spirochaetales bacterium]
MLIPSIDISQGKVVQLKQGETLMLERDNPEQLVQEFSLYGVPALIDIDAAKGEGSNRNLITSLLKLQSCIVGGGIRTIEDARYYIANGAKKIIIGSSIFSKKPETGQYTINEVLLSELQKTIGRSRIIAALDVRDETVVINGWKSSTALNIFSLLPKIEQYAGTVLITSVHREGLMAGTDLQLYKKIRETTNMPVIAAGGIFTQQEIQALAQLNIDSQLGMALYTNQLSLPDAFSAQLNWSSELLPVIAQSPEGSVLMLGYTNQEALKESFLRRKLCFYSRSRKRLWMKGETSGNTLALISMRTDCDRDTILAQVVPKSPVCHTGNGTCFGEPIFTLEQLQNIIRERFTNPTPGSYTATLDDSAARAKLMEEAQEVCEANTAEEVIWESADVLYFLLVLMTKKGVSLDAVLRELERRRRLKQ